MKINFKSGTVDIDLIPNKFVDQWYNTVSKLEPIPTWNENLFPQVTMSQQEIDAIRNKYVPKFNAHVQELKDKYNLDFPGLMKNISY